MAHSKVLKEWRDTDKKITYCYNEAKDNAKFIQALETKCHSLYLDNPVCNRWKFRCMFNISKILGENERFYIGASTNCPINT